MGEYLHAFEDTYAHCTGVGDRDWEYHGNINVLGFTVAQNGGYTGHGHRGHEPDHTWRDVAKGMKMAEAIYSELISFSIVNSSPSSPPTPANWSSIKPQVEKFLAFTPNVYKQTEFKVFVVENVTFGGYTEKIHLLDAGYNIDRIYADRNVYEEVTGQRPSKTIAGATSCISAGIAGANFVFGPFVGIQ